LTRSLEGLFEKGLEFLKDPAERTVLIHHKDADGICSASVMLKALESMGQMPSNVVASSNEEVEHMFKVMEGFDRIIVLDIDISYLKEMLDASEKRILLIDHHPPRHDINSDSIVYVNPRLAEPGAYQPASYLVWKMFCNHSDLGDVEWLAALGTIADLGFEDCMDLISKFTDVKEKYDLAKTQYWKYAEMLDACITENGFEKTLYVIRRMKSFEEFAADNEVKSAFEKFSESYGRLEEEFWKNAKDISDINLIISEFSSEDRAMSSLLATNIALENPSKIIILMRRVGEMYAVNARYEGEAVDLGRIMQISSDGLNGGGGHANAAGATIKAKNSQIFKERLIKELSDFYTEQS
jgi:single-stranded DNA-specific DHH superfamily exonuclease